MEKLGQRRIYINYIYTKVCLIYRPISGRKFDENLKKKQRNKRTIHHRSRFQRRSNRSLCVPSADPPPPSLRLPPWWGSDQRRPRTRVRHALLSFRFVEPFDGCWVGEWWLRRDVDANCVYFSLSTNFFVTMFRCSSFYLSSSLSISFFLSPFVFSFRFFSGTLTRALRSSSSSSFSLSIEYL